MATDEDEADRDRRLYSTFIRMAFTPYAIHFKSPSYMSEETLHRIDTRLVKETLRLTGAKGYIRNAIGNDPLFWEEISTTFRAAVTSLERRSFQQWDPQAVDYETTSSALIATASKGLTKDLERLNDLVAIVRNILTAGEKVQDLCADSGFDSHMLNLVNCCVRVTARGYDGEPGTGDEQKWQTVVNAYKKLLITSLQFMNNYCARNESNKLILWMALFDNGEPLPSDQETDRAYIEKIKDELERKRTAALLEKANRQATEVTDGEQVAISFNINEAAKAMTEPESDAAITASATKPSEEDGLNAYALFWRHKTDHLRPETTSEAEIESLHAKTYEEWVNLEPYEATPWQERWDDIDFDLQRRFYFRFIGAMQLGLPTMDPTAVRLGNIERQLYADLRKAHGNKIFKDRSNYEGHDYLRLLLDSDEVHTMRCSAADATKILEEGKEALGKRLNMYTVAQQAADEKSADAASLSESHEGGPVTLPAHPPPPPPPPSNDRESDDESEYHGVQEDGRGLLTDVPLILGPSEIEILPNIIMSGLSPRPPQASDPALAEQLVNMHFMRSHLLLAQENGQNLLRELLIFVAAWDLREEELYFKFMVNIMEALLINGLIPYAYHVFRDISKSRSKDIISPAQAVIMKLLTNIFRKNAESYKALLAEHRVPVDFTAVEVHVVNFLFTEFRKKIVPQTCALIHCQGTIHNSSVPPEDFPLNLWDMERMYEGVYQYLEFFAVLTEEQAWKDIMAKWEVAHELVTILKELEKAIPRLSASATGPAPASKARSKQKGKAGPSKSNTQPPALDSKDVSKALDTWDTEHAPPSAMTETMAEGFRQEQLMKMEKIKDALAKMKKKNLPPEQKQSADALADELQKLEGLTLKAPLPPPEPESQLPYPEEAQDEPSDFEWRNLKKLTVLVLSSLIWKNKTVQDQVREFGGLEALIACCRPDEHNPYIREHAIMCLRFAVEGNAENAEVIRNMAISVAVKAEAAKMTAQQVSVVAGPMGWPEVPKEVLDTQGYETFMDGKGQVGLRRKDVSGTAGGTPGPSGTSSLAAMPASGPAAVTTGTATVTIPAGGVTSAQSAKVLKEAAAQAIRNAITGPTGLALKIAHGQISTKVAAEHAAVLVQNVLQDLPLPEGLDQDGREIISRLNKAALENVQLGLEIEREAARR